MTTQSSSDVPATGDVLVTGATGTVGAEVAKLLADRGVPVRAAARTPGEVPRMEHVQPVRLDFMQPGTFPAALRGARQVFLMRPPAIAWVERHLFPFIAAAEEAGVRHVAFLSIIGAEGNPLVPHRRVEKRLEDSPVRCTLLRPAYFMQNLATAQGRDIRGRDEIFVPAGSGRTAFVDARDVAAVAARALTGDVPTGRAYDLTSDETLRYDEVAEVLSGVLGREITYADPSLFAYAWRMLRRGHPPGYVLVTAALFTAARLGLSARLAPEETRRALGRAPTPLRAFAEDYKEHWRA